MRATGHTLPFFLVIAAALPSLCACKRAEDATHPAATAAPAVDARGPAERQPEAAVADASGNPVQNEMRILHEATRDWVSAVANNTLDVIPASIGKVHGARMLTEKAVEAGAYRPPKNGNDLAGFARLDESFHAELVKLLQASRAQDLRGATRQLGVVLEGCTSCHLQFRY